MVLEHENHPTSNVRRAWWAVAPHVCWAVASPADLHIVGSGLHVRLDPLSAPRGIRPIAGPCEELTATKTTYPGTDLALVCSVKQT